MHTSKKNKLDQTRQHHHDHIEDSRIASTASST